MGYIKRECAWCGKDQGRTETGNDKYEGTSHTICAPCKEENFPDSPSSKDKDKDKKD